MSFLRRGNRRGRRSKSAVVLATVGALLGIQALAAVPASAAVTCAFAGGVMTVNTDPNDSVGVQQNNTTGTIQVNALECAPVAPIATTTSIVINGDTGGELVIIRMYNTSGATISWGTVNWSINLGSNGAAEFDEIDVFDGAATSGALNTVFGASGIDLNNDDDLDVTHAGVERLLYTGGPGRDTISGAGNTATGGPTTLPIFIGNGGAENDTLTGGSGADNLDGEAGDDTVAGGLGDDSLDGGEGGETNGDTVDYSGSAAAVNVNLATGNGTGEGLDTIPLLTVENITGSGFNDTLTGDGEENWIIPGPGDDSVVGGAPVGVSFGDTISLEDSTGPATVDIAAGTATGNGSDTFSGIENAQGSEFDDDLKGSSGYNGLFGGGGNDLIAGMGGGTVADPDDLQGEGGVDTVDYSWSGRFVTLNLNCGTGVGTGVIGGTTLPTNDTIRTMENAILTSGDDTFFGNEFSNSVWPNGGQNSLNGDGGTICPAGTPAAGGDVLDYGMGYESGVNVNMAGGATAGDSAVGFENARGTAFADDFVGNTSSNTIAGRGGNDTLRLGSGDDTGRGGPGKDSIFGGSGDDLLVGAKGNDTLLGGGGDDLGKGGPGKDRCRGVEIRRSCGTFRNPAAPSARLARLV